MNRTNPTIDQFRAVGAVYDAADEVIGALDSWGLCAELVEAVELLRTAMRALDDLPLPGS